MYQQNVYQRCQKFHSNCGVLFVISESRNDEKTHHVLLELHQEKVKQLHVIATDDKQVPG